MGNQTLGLVFENIVSLGKSLVKDSLSHDSAFIVKFGNIFCWKNVKNFCSAKVLKIFQQKIVVSFHITCWKFKYSITKDFSLEQLVPGC